MNNTDNTTPSGVYLKLFNGRLTLDEELDGPGADGPIFGPFPCVHTTFGDNLKFDPVKGILLPLTESTIFYNGYYYSDWSVFDHATFLADGLDKSGRLQPFNQEFADPDNGGPDIADPDGMNEERADWAKDALHTFMKDNCMEFSGDEDLALKDLLVDCQHLLDRQPEYLPARYCDGTRSLVADVVGQYLEETLQTGKPKLFAWEMKHLQFSRFVLRRMDEMEEWDSDMLEEFASFARSLKLVTHELWAEPHQFESSEL